VATSTFKAETYRFLRQGEAEPSPRWGGESPPNADAAVCPPGTIHLPDWADGEWLKQLTAEQLVTVRTKRGFARLEWQKLRERNEALDCRVYARAAAWIAGADRWPEARWQELERQMVVETEPPKNALQPASRRAAPARRRSVRSSYMG
jgi:phage terminase large subunit GpA-like protein